MLIEYTAFGSTSYGRANLSAPRIWVFGGCKEDIIFVVGDAEKGAG